MVLADTSVWIEHLRRGQPSLAKLLAEGVVLMHPFVYGEIACGNLHDRSSMLSNLDALPSAKPASHVEVMHLLETNKLSGRGLGWIDMHLLASALVSKCLLWTLDRRLAQAAAELKLC